MFAPGAPITIPPMVSVFTQGIGGVTEAFATSAPASATYESANLAVYFPIFLPAPCIVKRVWWVNGATVSGGATIEVGVYANAGYKPGAKLVSGSATQGNASEVQFVDVTDTSLAPGLYWICIVSNSATNTTLARSVLGTALYEALRFNQVNASPLPATATPAEASNSPAYLCGFSTTSTANEAPQVASGGESYGGIVTIPPVVSAFTQGVGWLTESISATAPASATYESTGRASYSPVFLPSSCVAKRVWWTNGATTSGGATVECGIYGDAGYKPGGKIISGSATQGNANEVQFVDVTDTALSPGLYWIAFVASTTTNTTFFRASTGGMLDASHRMQEPGASPLPATASPIESTNTDVYLCGFSTTAS